MAESMCRTLRDGSLEGEQAPALTIKDTVASPFGFHVFSHVLSQLSSFILGSKSQSRGIVIVAFSRSPSFYVDLLKRRGIDVNSSHKWIQILDCYTDPLCWKDQLMGSGNFMDASHETSSSLSRVCKDVKNLDKLYSMILELGKGLVGKGKDRFSVAIDSINEMLRHTSTPTVAGLLSNLRSHEQISSIFWLLHSDPHEVKVTSVLEYLSYVVVSVEPLHQTANGQRRDLENLSLLEQNFGKGKLQVRFKRRNGHVRVMSEGFHIDQSDINFTSVSSEDGLFNQINQGLLPKVQFNLDLSEKERIGRAWAVLSFDHQGNGKPIQIHDSGRSLAEGKTEVTLGSSWTSQKAEDYGEGDIIYFLDSDDEMPDSDEDSDDDLDV
uniref:Elongator complex protein 5 n=1 Tax=Populus davidiana TaxID=266767 RepID=A0A6M2ENW7_9ROSI